jgi:hypothetical protein
MSLIQGRKPLPRPNPCRSENRPERLLLFVMLSDLQTFMKRPFLLFHRAFLFAGGIFILIIVIVRSALALAADFDLIEDDADDFGFGFLNFLDGFHHRLPGRLPGFNNEDRAVHE